MKKLRERNRIWPTIWNNSAISNAAASVDISRRIDYLNGLLADLTPDKVPRHLVMNNDGRVNAAALLDHCTG